MYVGFAGPQNQAGQTAVLFALMLVGLFALIGLAVDGGSVFNARRVAQNAVDGAALTGVHFLVGSDVPTETRLREVVNGVVEANEIPDTDGVPGNAVNENVTIYYTDARGNRLTTQPCHTVPCGSIPTTARGLEVIVDHQVVTYFLGVIDRDSLEIAADAVAVVTAGSGGATIRDNVLVAFGNCTQSDRPLDVSAGNVDFIGSVHSNTWFANGGDDNHYHGQVTYGDAYGWEEPAAVPGAYQPDPPGRPEPDETTPGEDPLAGRFTVDDFNCDDGAIGTHSDVTCYDLTDHAPDYGNVITTQLLKERSPDGGDPFLYEVDVDEWRLRPGLYYGGTYPFVFGQEGVIGNVTIVTNNTIKLTDDDVQLTGYMPPGTPSPGLLLYSSLQPASPYNSCTSHGDLPEDQEAINMTANTGSVRPGVYHKEERAGCINLDNPSNCYELGSLKYVGLIYAPYGRVAVSGNGASYVGAIVAPAITVAGTAARTTDTTPDSVGALFVRDPNLFPSTEQLISLER